MSFLFIESREDLYDNQIDSWIRKPRLVGATARLRSCPSTVALPALT